MKKLTIDITDQVFPYFIQAFKETNLALLREVENAILDGDSGKAKDLMNQIARNMEAMKIEPVKVVAAPKVVKPVELPMDTKEVIEARKQTLFSTSQPVLPKLEDTATNKVTPLQALKQVIAEEKPKRNRKPKEKISHKGNI